MTLPDLHERFTDTYFLRSLQILKEESLNPWVTAQIFIRDGNARIFGIDVAVSMIKKYSKLFSNGGLVFALKEGDHFDNSESVMVIEGPIQDIITLETVILGVISADTTTGNGGPSCVDLETVEKNMRAVVSASKGRKVIYMGARHWSFNEDAKISFAAFKGGATAASTDEGAETFGQKGVGTIPHSLEAVFAWKYGSENAVLESVKAFDRYIEADVPRVALVDYDNREVDDSLQCARCLGNRLNSVRIDTPGENIGQCGYSFSDATNSSIYSLCPKEDFQYWYGPGVKISSVYAVRKALNENGFPNVQIVLSSGFGNPEKVKAFAKAEKVLEMKLFDTLGVGEVFPSRIATMDVVLIGSNSTSQRNISKKGRGFKPNPRLKQV